MQQLRIDTFYRPPLNLHSHFKVRVKLTLHVPVAVQCFRSHACFLFPLIDLDKSVYISRAINRSSSS